MSNQLVNPNTGEPLPDDLQEAMSLLKEQLLIAFVHRMGDEVVIPAKEVDETGKYIMEMTSDPATGLFTFKVKKKQ